MWELGRSKVKRTNGKIQKLEWKRNFLIGGKALVFMKKGFGESRGRTKVLEGVNDNDAQLISAERSHRGHLTCHAMEDYPLLRCAGIARGRGAQQQPR